MRCERFCVMLAFWMFLPIQVFAQTMQTIDIGVLALRGEAKAVETWQPVAQLLNKRLPQYHFNIVPLDFDEIHLAVRQKRIDFVIANSAFYVELEHDYGVSPVVTLKTLSNQGVETHQFGGVIFSCIECKTLSKLSDLPHHSLAAVDPSSLGGWQAGWHELMKHGIYPHKDLQEVAFLGTHDAVVKAVLAGEYDAGIVRTGTLEKMVKEGLIPPHQWIVLAEKQVPNFPFQLSTTLYPEWPIAKVSGVDEQIAIDLAVTLMKVSQAEFQSISPSIAGWSLPMNYQPVHDTLKALKLGPYQYLRQISWREIIEQYGYVLVLVLLFVGFLSVLAAYVNQTNKRLARKSKELNELNNSLEERVEERTLTIELLNEKKLDLQKERIHNYEQTITSMVDMIEKRDSYTAGHSHRVAEYCVMIARQMGLNEERIQTLKQAAILHDIGKIVIPDAVLLKPGRLTDFEYELIKQHVDAGYEMLSKIKMYQELAEIMRYHHERLDGSGYPKGLKGDEIPLEGRIMAVADTFDAMVSHRIYQPGLAVQFALDELKSLSGTHYDPDVVEAACYVFEDFQPGLQSPQMPQTDIERQRFVYFFNDSVTGAYNADYLEFALTMKLYPENHFVCKVALHGMKYVNAEWGWSYGNEVLNSVVSFLSQRCPDSLVFRIMGDDFIVLSRLYNPVQKEEIESQTLVGETRLTIEIDQMDLGEGQHVEKALLESVGINVDG